MNPEHISTVLPRVWGRGSDPMSDKVADKIEELRRGIIARQVGYWLQSDTSVVEAERMAAADTDTLIATIRAEGAERVLWSDKAVANSLLRIAELNDENQEKQDRLNALYRIESELLAKIDRLEAPIEYDETFCAALRAYGHSMWDGNQCGPEWDEVVRLFNAAQRRGNGGRK